jgi:hypothetical protein
VRRGETVAVRIGSYAIQLRQSQADEYIVMKVSSSNKGWHQRWFYLRSDADAPLPPYTGCFFGEALECWGYGPIASEKKKIDSLLQAIKRLVDAGMAGAGVIAAFHERRVLPLIRRAHHLDEMVPNAPLEGTVLVTGELDQEEIKRRITSALGSVPPNAVLDAHPPMHPDDDFIEVVSILHSSPPSSSPSL